MIIRLVSLILVAVVWSSPFRALALDLNDLIEIGGDIIDANKKVSVEEEIELGGNLISGLLGAAPLVDNAELQHYVNDVGFWVASQSKRKDLPWRFGVIDSAGINAFAAPGGYIVLTLGLFSLLENEAQLAGVLGHEISHVIKKHHLKALQKTMKRGIWGKIGVRALADKDDHETFDKVVNAGVQLYASGLDRDLEYQADKRGVVLAARAGYDPYALLDVLTTIDSINPTEADMTVMLKTHPPTSKRLKKLAKLMDGKLDKYANGMINSSRFIAVSSRLNR
ncbi:MAG: M48 family metalloprotease [Gammaproteobacteria bacterium]|nr:M48 family metalloprotease [Gammaproteobacteria bacterium]